MSHPTLEGVVKTAVSEKQFEKVWAPRGWQLVPDEQPVDAAVAVATEVPGQPVTPAARPAPAPTPAPVDPTRGNS